MYNFTINLQTLEEKYYHFNTSFDFVKKQTAQGIEAQFALSRVPINLWPLQEFLGFDISLDDVFVDTYDFQSDSFWIMTEATSMDQQVKLYARLLEKFELEEKEFLHWVGYLNSMQLTSLQACAEQHAIACIRVPLQSNRLKVYARPFRYHHFQVEESIIARIKEVLQCDQATFDKQLEAGGVSYDFSDGRIVLFTQNDALKQAR